MLQIFYKNQLREHMIERFYMKLNHVPGSHVIPLEELDLSRMQHENMVRRTTTGSTGAAVMLHDADMGTIRKYLEEAYSDLDPDMAHLISHSIDRERLPVGRFLRCRVNVYRLRQKL